MVKKLSNYAFIDGTNLYLSINELGWKFDSKKLRRYLREKYDVKKAFYCIGYIKEYELLYKRLKRHGYKMVYKDTYITRQGKIKGNCDPELVMKVTGEKANYNKAIIISNDGDFASLVRELRESDKLEVVLAPTRTKCSHLLKRAARDKIRYIEDLRAKIEL